MSSHEFPIKTNWGRVPKDKAVCPSATPNEARRISVVQECVQKNPDVVFSEVLLSEESLRGSLLPLGYLPSNDRVIMARPRVVPVQKCSSDPSPPNKGKKPRLKSAQVDSMPSPGALNPRELATLEVSHPVVIATWTKVLAREPTDDPP